MADYAHNETDKRIAELEKRLTEEYRQAYKETKDKLEKYGRGGADRADS